MAEYVTVNSRREKTTDIMLDHMLKVETERAMDLWKLSFLDLLAEQMLTATEPDRTSMIHEMLFVIRGT